MQTIGDVKVMGHFDALEDYGAYYSGPWMPYRELFVGELRNVFAGRTGLKVLDLGAGRQTSLPTLLREPFVSEYHCVDFSGASLCELKRRAGDDPKIRLFESDVVSFVEGCKESYDIVILFGVVMYLGEEDAQRLFTGIERVLSSKGVLLSHEPNERGRSGLDRHGRPSSEAVLERMGETKGMVVVKSRNYNIPWLRSPFFLASSALRKTLAPRVLRPMDAVLWRMEFFLESLVSQRAVGVDSMTVVEKKGAAGHLLDLGCGVRKRKGATGVDIVRNACVDVVHDLDVYPYPFADNEFDDILLDNSIEHLGDIVKTMEEVWRISRPGALITIKVPYFRNHFAVDPTHRHYFASHSFHYFDPAHEFHRLYRYSERALFSVEKVAFDQGFRYSAMDKVRFSLPRLVANRWPLRYEEYLSHLFPLHELTFHLRTLKEAGP